MESGDQGKGVRLMAWVCLQLRGSTGTQQRLGIDRDDNMIHVKGIDAESKGIFRVDQICYRNSG
jgi:hypothetical protein